MGLAALRQAAADDFVRVEYIENTSTAYINSGIFGTMNLDFYVEFEPTQLHQNSGKGLGSIFGSRAEWNQNVYQLTTFNKNATNKGHFIAAKNYGFSDNRVPTANMFLGGKNIIKKEGLIFTRADGTTFNLTSQSFTTPTRISIFGVTNVNGGVGENCKFKLYKLQFSKNGTLVRDFIPMYQISKDTYGLWDRVEEKFYTSPNGVKFTGGERVIADANENLYYLKNYINVSNNQRKDLGYQPVGNDSWEGKFYFIGTGRQDIIGAWNSQGQKQYGFMGIENRQMRFLYNTQTVYNTLSYGNKTFTLKADKNKFYIYDANNKLLWNSSATYTSGNNPVRNFIVGHLNDSVYASNARMYYFKYMRGDNLVWDLIPVQRCSDKVWGLFCKVHNSFYESDGGTAFTGG